MPQAYRVLDNSLAAQPVAVGTIVYECHGHDYGCANDDTMIRGFPHVSVTLDPQGGYPFFTIPEHDLEEVL